MGATLIRIPMLVASAIVAVLVVGWALYALDANESTWIVGVVMDVARFFADPFRFIFELDNNVLQLAINWGIAAAAYVLAAVLLRALLRLLVGAASRRHGGGPRTGVHRPV